MNRTVNIVLLAIFSVLALYFLTGSVSAGSGSGLYLANCTTSDDCASTLACDVNSTAQCICDVDLVRYNDSLCVSACTNATCTNGGVCESSGICNCTIDFDGPTCSESLIISGNSSDNTGNGTTDPSSPASNNSSSNGTSDPSNPAGNNSTSNGTTDPSHPASNNSTNNSTDPSNPSNPAGNNSTNNGTTDPSNPASNNSSSNGTANPTNPTSNNSSSNGTANPSNPSNPAGNNNTSNGTTDPSNPTSNNSSSNGTANPSNPASNNSSSNGTSDPSNPTSNNSSSNGTANPTNPTSNNSSSNGTANPSNPSNPGGNNNTSNGTTDPSNPTSNNSSSNGTVDPTNPTSNNSSSNGTTDPCANVNCGAHGSCSKGVCTCSDSYTGTNCETAPSNNNTDPCANVKCGAHGSCSNGVCTCTDSYTGTNCETAPSNPTNNNGSSNGTVDPCANVKCGAHGSCSNGVCTCTDSYTGTNCETAPSNNNTDPCANINCGAHGSCSNGVCTCTDSYTGTNCETAPANNNTDPCANVKCGANGSCKEGKCVCKYGDEGKDTKYFYFGAACETKQYIMCSTYLRQATLAPFCNSVGVTHNIPLFAAEINWNLFSDYPTIKDDAMVTMIDAEAKQYADTMVGNCKDAACNLAVKRYACYTHFPQCSDTTGFYTPVCKSACEKAMAPYASPLSEICPDTMPNSDCSSNINFVDQQCVNNNVKCAHGSCANGTCTCETGYTGTLCDQAVVLNNTDPCAAVQCGDNGSCSKGVCVCNAGYTGSKCELPTCNGKSESEGGCSYHGKCGATDKCTCNSNFDPASYCSKCVAGFTGADCLTPICYTVPATDSSVCSGKGSCIAKDTCSCNSGYSGKTCSSFTCWGIDKANTTAVCGGKGTCVGPNKCSCATAWNNLAGDCTTCSPAFSGETCSTPVCDANTTCSSHGSCVNLKCVCSGNWDGEFCKVCKAGFVGDNCEIACSASTSCSGNGACTNTGACTCNGNFDFTQKCANGKCINGYQGNACNYKVSETTFKFNKFGDRIIATVYNGMKRSVNCSQVFTTVSTLGTGAQCIMDGVDKLEVVLGAGATVKVNDVLNVYKLFGDVSSGIISATVATGDFVPVNPTAYLTADKAVVSTCDTVTLNAFDSVSTDRRPLTFAWACTTGPSADAQTALNNAIKTIVSSGVRLNLNTLTLAAGTYVVQVTVTSSFSVSSSSSKTVSFTVTASPAPTLSIKEGLAVEYLIGAPGIITPVISFPTCYHGNGTVAYTFAFINSVATPTIISKDNMVVIGKTNTAISTVGDYNLVVTAAADGAATVSTTVKIKAVAKPLTVAFSVPDMTQSKEDAVAFTIDAKDPSETSGTITTSTTCVDADGNSCDGPGATFTFSKKMTAGKYTYTTTATKDSRSTTAKLTITVVDTSKDKIIRVSITSNVDLSAVDPTKDLYLTYNTLDALTTAATFAWTCDSNDQSSSSILVVSKANLVPGATYTATLNIVDGAKSGSAVVSFSVNSPPTKGIFEAYPLSGAALSDSFDLKCGNGWTDPQTPLKFQFLYLDAASNNWVSLTEKTEQQSAKVQLPSPTSGDVLKVKAVVIDALGAATESEQVSITITKPSTAAATTALTDLASSKGTITLSAASSAMSVIATVDLTSATAEQKAAITQAATNIADQYLDQQAKTEAVTQVSAASAENSLSFTASLSSSVSKGLVSDTTTSKVVDNLATTTSKVASSSSVSLSDSVLDSTKSTADNFYTYISSKTSRGGVPPVSSLRAFSKVDLDNLNSVYSSVASLKTKDAVPDAPAASVSSNGLTTVSRKVNLATLATESQVISGKNKITFKSAITANSALSALKFVTYAVKTAKSTVTAAASKSIDFSVSSGVTPVTVTDNAVIADLVFDVSSKRSIAATTYVCNKVTNGVAAADSTCTVVVGNDNTVTASVKSTGVYVLTTTTPVTPAATKSTKINAAPSMSFSALVVALVAAVVAAL